MAGLLDFWGTPQPGPDGRDPVLSLLAPFVTGGAIAPAGPAPDGAPPWAVPTDSRTAAMAGWGAFNQALLRAGEKTLGPAQSTFGAIGDALAAGSSAARTQQAADWMQKRQEFALGMQMQDQQRKQAALKMAFGAFMPAGTDTLTPGAAPGASPGGVPALGGAAGQDGEYPGASVRDVLRRAESGGKPDANNQFGFKGLYQFGVPLAIDAGFYEPAQGENPRGNAWTGSFKIPGFPDVKNLGDFLANPAAQDEAFRLGMAAKDRQASAAGLYSYIGQTRAGVPITRDGILAGAWLGGVGGVQRFLQSDGKDDPVDGNGTPVSRYVGMGASARGAAPPPNLTPQQQGTWQRLSPEGRQAVMATMIADPDKGIAMLAQSAIQDANRDRFVVLTPEQARARGITDTSRSYQLNVATQKVEAMPDTPARFRVLTPEEAATRGLSTNQRWQLNERDNQVSALPDQPQKRILGDAEAQQRMGPGYRPGSTYIETVGPDGTTRDIQTMVIADRAGLVANEPQAIRIAVDLGQQLGQDPRIKGWRETESRFDAVLVGLNENTRAGAEAAVESIAKIFDPNAVVRDHKLEMAASYGGMQQRLQEMIGKGIGASGLTTDARRQLASLAWEEMKTRDQAVVAALGEARATAAAAGLDPKMVLPKIKLLAAQRDDISGDIPDGITFRPPLRETPNGRFELTDRDGTRPVMPEGKLPREQRPPAGQGAGQGAGPAGFDGGAATPLPDATQPSPAAPPSVANAMPPRATSAPPAAAAPEISPQMLQAMDAAAFAALRQKARDQRPDFTDEELRLIDAEQRRRSRRN